jgi:hypothetical protein
MKKALVLLSISLLLGLGACASSDVSTGGTNNSTEKKPATTTTSKPAAKEENVKKISATATAVDVLGMHVGLGDIKISEDKIEVGVNLNNTTTKKLIFYPDQGQLVVGDMQLDANVFMTSGKVGGEVQGGVKQDAVLVFTAPEGKKLDVKLITQIKLIFGDVTTDDFMDSKPVELTVPVQ